MSLGLKDEFEIAVVKEPSVFEPLKFYCMAFNLIFVRYSESYSFYLQLKSRLIDRRGYEGPHSKNMQILSDIVSKLEDIYNGDDDVTRLQIWPLRYLH